MEITRDILVYALEMAGKIEARAVLLAADVFADLDQIRACLDRDEAGRIVLIARGREEMERLRELGVKAVQVPGLRFTRLGQVKVAVLLGLSQGLFHRGDRLVCLTGIRERKTLDTILFLEVGEEREMFSGERLEEVGSHVNPEVFERVLDLAVALGAEGREGHPVGTCFVIGDSEKVLDQSVPLVLNPFRGYPEEERNILDPGLTETVKEFAAIDGAFVIRGDGLIEAAGVYLRPSATGEKLPWGLGTRHASAAGITAATESIAVVVSASTGNVTVFREGRIFIELERLRALVSHPSDRESDRSAGD